MSILLSNLFIIYSLQYGLPENLLSSLCYVESKHDINAYHKDDGKGNSVGVCQVKRQTAQLMGFSGTEKELMEPETNIHFAAAYLAHQIHRYHNIKYGIIAYNIGSRKNLQTSKYYVKVNKQWRMNVKSK